MSESYSQLLAIFESMVVFIWFTRLKLNEHLFYASMLSEHFLFLKELCEQDILRFSDSRAHPTWDRIGWTSAVSAFTFN